MTTFKKIVLYSSLFLVVFTACYMAYVFYVPYSKGTRTGELIKVDTLLNLEMAASKLL